MYVMSWDASTFMNTFCQLCLKYVLNWLTKKCPINISNSKELGQGFVRNTITRSILAKK